MAGRLKALIGRELSAGDELLTPRELAPRLNASVATLRVALELLAIDGTIHSQGRGRRLWLPGLA